MKTEQNTFGMESVIELIWNPEKVSALGGEHDHREGGNTPPDPVVPVIRPPVPPPPFWTVRFMVPGLSCG